jgi:hypothetical protein
LAQLAAEVCAHLLAAQVFVFAALLQVVTAGQYEITLYYQSDEDATFRLWVGPYSKIEDGTAMHLDARLPADVSGCRHY